MTEQLGPVGMKKARLIKGFSQEYMAEALAIHPQTYSKIEKNPESATVAQAKRISKVLSVPIDEIFFGNDI